MQKKAGLEGQRKFCAHKKINKSIFKRNSFTIIFLLIMAVAVFLRLYKLELRPIHHDEGVYASFVQGILKSGNYPYDAEYHGPVLFFLDALAFKIFGVRVLALRIVPALFGIFILLLLPLLKKYIGKKSVLITALLITISSIYEYFSRFGFHEALFIFFTLLLIITMLKYSESQKNIYFYLSAANTAMLFCIKETAYFVVPIIFSFFIFNNFIQHAASIIKSKNTKSKTYLATARIEIRNFFSETINWIEKHKEQLAVSIIIFLFIFIMLYSSFFSHPSNLKKAFTQPISHSLTKATERSGHNKPFLYYLNLILDLDPFILLFAAIGLFINRRNKFSNFIIYIALLITLVLSITPYKTPWNVMFILFPVTLVAGMPFESIFKYYGDKKAVLAVVLLIIILTTSATMYRINFIHHCDDSKNRLSYAHAGRDMESAMKEIINKYPEDTLIIVSAKDCSYWPLPWFFWNFTNVAYYGELPQNFDNALVIIASKNQNETFWTRANNANNYSEREFETHPGTRFIIYEKI